MREDVINDGVKIKTGVGRTLAACETSSESIFSKLSLSLEEHRTASASAIILSEYKEVFY